MEQPPLIETLSPGLSRIVFSSRLYAREALFAASHCFNDHFYVKIEPHGEESHAVLLQQRENIEPAAEKKILEFLNRALEEQVRLDLAKRTGALREIIYRHAFLPLEERKETP